MRDELPPKRVPLVGVVCAGAGFVGIAAFAWLVISILACHGPFVGLSSEGSCEPSDSILPLITLSAAPVGAGLAWRIQRWWPLFLGAAVTLCPLVPFLAVT